MSDRSVGTPGVTGAVTRRAVTSVERVRFEWVIKDFSLLPDTPGEYLLSPNFSSKDDARTNWCLCLYPGGETDDCKGWVSLYLDRTTDVMSANVKAVKAAWKFSVLKATGEYAREDSCNHVFGGEPRGWGPPRYIPRAQLLDKTSGLLTDDNLTLVCNLTARFDSDESNRLPTEARSDDDTKQKDEIAALAGDMSRLFNSPVYSDVELVIGDYKLPAHRAILAARSAVFTAMFERDVKGQKKTCVTITDVDPDLFREVLRFIYTGTVRNLAENARQLRTLGSKYGLMGLMSLCEQQLSEENEVNDFVDLK